MGVSKYFNNLVKNTNVLFDKDARVGCVHGCGNKIMILKGSLINCLPKCAVCIDPDVKIYEKGARIRLDNWARCGQCQCLFWVPKDDNIYLGKNPKCEICVSFHTY
jgi:hypothetical protein